MGAQPDSSTSSPSVSSSSSSASTIRPVDSIAYLPQYTPPTSRWVEKVYTSANGKRPPVSPDSQWARLVLQSRRSAGKSRFPVYYEADSVSGSVELKSEKCGHKIRKVEIIVTGRVQYGNLIEDQVVFLNERKVLWNSKSTSTTDQQEQSLSRSSSVSSTTSSSSRSTTSSGGGCGITPLVPTLLPFSIPLPTTYHDDSLPPSFTERASPVSILYSITLRIVVKKPRSSTLPIGSSKDIHLITTPFVYMPTSRAPSQVGSAVLNTQGTPYDDPQSWTLAKSVTFRGVLFKRWECALQVEVFLGRGKTYTLGTRIPIFITLSSPNELLLNLACSGNSESCSSQCPFKPTFHRTLVYKQPCLNPSAGWSGADAGGLKRPSTSSGIPNSSLGGGPSRGGGGWEFTRPSTSSGIIESTSSSSIRKIWSRLSLSDPQGGNSTSRSRSSSRSGSGEKKKMLQVDSLIKLASPSSSSQQGWTRIHSMNHQKRQFTTSLPIPRNLVPSCAINGLVGVEYVIRFTQSLVIPGFVLTSNSSELCRGVPVRIVTLASAPSEDGCDTGEGRGEEDSLPLYEG